MKCPFVPKDGDNFDIRYCESVQHIDTLTKERYQYYKIFYVNLRLYFKLYIY